MDRDNLAREMLQSRSNLSEKKTRGAAAGEGETDIPKRDLGGFVMGFVKEPISFRLGLKDLYGRIAEAARQMLQGGEPMGDMRQGEKRGRVSEQLAEREVTPGSSDVKEC